VLVFCVVLYYVCMTLMAIMICSTPCRPIYSFKILSIRLFERWRRSYQRPERSKRQRVYEFIYFLFYFIIEQQRSWRLLQVWLQARQLQ